MFKFLLIFINGMNGFALLVQSNDKHKVQILHFPRLISNKDLFLPRLNVTAL